MNRGADSPLWLAYKAARLRTRAALLEAQADEYERRYWAAMRRADTRFAACTVKEER
jgi:hypothetical protein